LESLPEIDKWRAHRTCPTTEFFADWTLRYEKLVWFMSPRDYLAAGTLHTRADNRPQEEELCQQDMPKEWIPDLSDAEEIKDPVDRMFRIFGLKYSAVSILVLECMRDVADRCNRMFTIHICDMDGAVKALISRLAK
jgi:hypothetical protein